MKVKTCLPVLNVAIVFFLTTSIGFTAKTFAQTQSTAPANSTPAAKETIQEVQERLLGLGYQPGAADGVMGAKAIAALKKFQADHSLPPTGQLDQKTLTALNAKTLGSKPPQSPDRAFSAEAVCKSAAQGSPSAQYTLGLMYDQGWEEQLDHAEAIRWLRKAAEQGYASAQARLGEMYHQGNFVPQDYSEAANWNRKAAEQGSPTAQLGLGTAFALGEGVPKSPEDAAIWLKKAAEQGNATAQYAIGGLFSAGNGVPQDYLESYVWLSLAYSRFGADTQKQIDELRNSVAGHLTAAQTEEAQHRVNEWKPAIDPNASKSVDTARKAAEIGDATAQNELGDDYDGGLGVAKDDAESASWYLKAAELGDLDAQVRIGLDYEQGTGVTQDYAQAAQWFQKAADKGKASAQRNLGLLYLHGNGVTKDAAEALRWMSKAAGQGDVRAQMEVCSDYLSGEVVPKDNASAYVWLSIVLSEKDNGFSGKTLANLVQVRDSLANGMPGAQIAEVERRVAEWRPAGEGSLLAPPPAQPSQPVTNGTGTYRLLTPADSLSCAYSQDLSLSLGGNFSGNITGTTEHFDCTNNSGKKIAVELKFAVSTSDGKVAIITKDFGVVFRGNEKGSFDKYEMTESQIANLKKFLGF